MAKLVFDADALIKLAKCGLLEQACAHFECVITQEVFEETVVAGLKEMREDALVLQALVARKNLKLTRVPKETRPTTGIGRGEASVLNACLKTHAIAVSDDRKFLGVLESVGAAFHTPASLVVSMYKREFIDRKKALDSLENLRPWIRREVFEKALQELRGG